MPLRLVRRPKSQNWVIRGTVRGIRVEKSTGVSVRSVAEEIRARHEAELLTESVYGKQATVTFAHAALDYMEHGGDRRFVAPLLNFFGTTLLREIEQDLLDKAAKQLFPKASPSTRNRQFFTPTSAILHHAARKGWCPRPVIARPKHRPGRVRWLELDEADRLIDACAPHLRPLVIFLLYTGARIGEALWLSWSELDLARRHVQFTRTKNGDARGVPLHARVVRALQGAGEMRGEVFRRPDGRPYAKLAGTGSDTSAGTRVKSAFSGACRRAGILDFHPHDCRHTWATWHYRANRDLGALQRLGGWKTLSMVMRYAHTNVAEHRHTIDSLPGGKAGEHEVTGDVSI